MTNQIAYYEAKLAFEIDSWDLYESLKKDEDIVVVDSRSEEAFQKEHIPGAINIPHRTINEQNKINLDKTKTYISYCDGIGCNASTKGALNLAKLGLNTKELIGGLDWWKRDGYKTEGEQSAEEKIISCGC